jgi:2-C-methyl-D-erythritol 4-phosphate cytidylyltransferase
MVSDPGAGAWAVVPAAGRGERFGGTLPKQYNRVLGRAVIDWTLGALLEVPGVSGIMVALGIRDSHWHGLAAAADSRVHVCGGGTTRAESVSNALGALAKLGVEPERPVLVHDAARPCVRPQAVARLLGEVGNDPNGGLLGLRVRDTLKRGDESDRVTGTVARDGLWQAQTPQLFPLGPLREALESAVLSGLAVTDEAQAMEHAGYSPRLVEGDMENLKLTLPSDLPLVEAILSARSGAGVERIAP